MVSQKKDLKSKPIKRLEEHLTKGNLWMYILSLLKKKKKYAYNLHEEIENKFGFKPSRITIYVVLYKMENEGLIESNFEQRRKYYTITKKGKENLTQGKKRIKELLNII